MKVIREKRCVEEQRGAQPNTWTENLQDIGPWAVVRNRFYNMTKYIPTMLLYIKATKKSSTKKKKLCKNIYPYYE